MEIVKIVILMIVLIVEVVIWILIDLTKTIPLYVSVNLVTMMIKIMDLTVKNVMTNVVHVKTIKINVQDALTIWLSVFINFIENKFI